MKTRKGSAVVNSRRSSRLVFPVVMSVREANRIRTRVSDSTADEERIAYHAVVFSASAWLLQCRGGSEDAEGQRDGELSSEFKTLRLVVRSIGVANRIRTRVKDWGRIVSDRMCQYRCCPVARLIGN